MVPKDSLNITIMNNNWKQQWKGQWESTSSLESDLHFGHYIAGCNSDHIAYFHALKLTLVIKRGIVLDWWSRGLSVMLEKLFGCALITKLRSFLLMEADFNSTNKIIYGQRMLGRDIQQEESIGRRQNSCKGVVLQHSETNKNTSRYRHRRCQQLLWLDRLSYCITTLPIPWCTKRGLQFYL